MLNATNYFLTQKLKCYEKDVFFNYCATSYLLFSQNVPEGAILITPELEDASVLYGSNGVNNIYIPPPPSGTLSTTPGQPGNANLDIIWHGPGWIENVGKKGAIERAVEIWEQRLTSNVDIKVRVSIYDMQFDPDEIVLAFAKPYQVYADFLNVDELPPTGTDYQPGVFYPIALANKMANVDLKPDNHDIDVYINSNENLSWFTST